MSRRIDSESGEDAGSSPLTSSSLLERVKSLDRGAWQRLVDVYAPLVYRWCRRTGVRPGDSFRGWLWTIACHKIHDQFRRQRNQPIAGGGSSNYERLCRIPDSLPSVSDAPPHSTDQAALAQRVVELIRPEVEERTWRAFWRLTVDGQPGPEVAAELGMTLQAVHQAKYRVLQRVRRELNDVPL